MIKMESTYFELTLSGKNSPIFNRVEQELKNYLSILNLPLKIHSIKNQDDVSINYLDQKILFLGAEQEKENRSLYELLSKINPKNGKICKCKNCGNCPSKR